MKQAIYVEHKCNHFCIRFHNSVVSLCPHQMLEILSDINKRESQALELGLLWSMSHQFTEPFRDKPEYQVCFGRTIFVMTQHEMIELIAQMWEKNPVLMHWICGEEKMSS